MDLKIIRLEVDPFKKLEFTVEFVTLDRMIVIPSTNPPIRKRTLKLLSRNSSSFM